MVETQASKRHWLLQVGPSPVISGHGALCQGGPFMMPLPPSGKIEKLQVPAKGFLKGRDPGERFRNPMAFGKIALIT